MMPNTLNKAPAATDTIAENKDSGIWYAPSVPSEGKVPARTTVSAADAKAMKDRSLERKINDLKKKARNSEKKGSKNKTFDGSWRTFDGKSTYASSMSFWAAKD